LLLRNRRFLKPFEPSRPNSYFTEEWQATRLARSETGRAFGIIQGESGELVGRLELSAITPPPALHANLGYWVDQGHNGRGYATEAVAAALAQAFDPGGLRLHRIQAAVMPRNDRSIRVLEKSGLRREGFAERYLEIGGRWEDHWIYAITAEEWPGAVTSSGGRDRIGGGFPKSRGQR